MTSRDLLRELAEGQDAQAAIATTNAELMRQLANILDDEDTDQNDTGKRTQ